ncbi:Spy/CpxP family protein refolding chaperone [Phenylobacterium sp. LjRoot225]|uniref:Spy/CpxP family protein refolding chaperone n=1 Tax=Phenylobacterium sp. LjRoot225 TaxID=3342285 RepID=UPI003ECC2413
MKLSTLALAGAIALSAAGASLAQPAPPPGGPAPADARRHDPAKMAEQHAQRLRAVLQLRPDQEPALRALVDSMKPAPGTRERRRDEHDEMRNLPTPQRLDRMQARMSERQTRFARRADAVKRFYAQLTPTQQRAFDALHDGPGGMRGGKGHGHGRGHGPERGPGGPHGKG